jgi:hypothetical protein
MGWERRWVGRNLEEGEWEERGKKGFSESGWRKYGRERDAKGESRLAESDRRTRLRDWTRDGVWLGCGFRVRSRIRGRVRVRVGLRVRVGVRMKVKDRLKLR